MSKCISRHGEYSDHSYTIGSINCELCGEPNAEHRNREIIAGGLEDAANALAGGTVNAMTGGSHDVRAMEMEIRMAERRHIVEVLKDRAARIRSGGL